MRGILTGILIAGLFAAAVGGALLFGVALGIVGSGWLDFGDEAPGPAKDTGKK